MTENFDLKKTLKYTEAALLLLHVHYGSVRVG
jgi:hypothetical protein